MVDFSQMRLGRKPAAPDPRTPRLMHHMMAIQPAPAVNWMGAVKQYDCLGNDQYGDCAEAAAFHISQTWRANNGFTFQPTTDQALALYGDVSNFPKEDDGTVLATLLAYWAKTGIPNDVGTETIFYASLTPTNLDELKLSIQYLGAAYIGVNLPISAQTQTGVWDVPAGGAVGDGAPGSWGGHALPLLAYDETGFVTITWGQVMRMTPAFIQAYCEEAYAIVSGDWLADSGISPPGLNMAGLQQEMAAITG
jgi:hypothetical protein